jgi:signal transduction histidine kinase
VPTDASFRTFAQRVTRGYVVLAVALIALVAGASSALAFMGFAGAFNATIDAAQERIGASVQSYQEQHVPLAQYAPKIVAGESHSRFRVYVYDAQHRVIAGASAQLTDSERLIEAILALHPRFIGIPGGGTIVIQPDIADILRYLGRYYRVILPIGILAVLIAWFAGRAITRRALRPLREVNAGLRSIADGDFTPKLLLESDASMRELTHTYNEVARRLNDSTRERERQDAELRQFIADAGHELRTPLTIFMGYLDALRSGVVQDGDGVARVHETMLEQSRKMRGIIEKLILLARMERPERPEPERIDLHSIAARAVDALRPLAGDRLSYAHNGEAVVLGDDAELYEAVKNVVENAVRYAPGSPVDVQVEQRGDEATLAVVDRGPGMSPVDVEHAFDRFYRGTSRGEVDGSGLGLAIAKRAVERVGGSISLESRAGEGTRVTMRFPGEASPQGPP